MCRNTRYSSKNTVLLSCYALGRDHIFSCVGSWEKRTRNQLSVTRGMTVQHVRLFFLLLIAGVLLASCGPTITSPTSVSTPTLSSEARTYLTVALDDMQRYALHRKTINWAILRQQAFQAANGANTPADTYLSISAALGALGDHHSFLLTPQDTNQQHTADLTPDQEPTGYPLTPGTGYLSLPHFEASQQAAYRYIQLAQEVIRTTDQAGMCGWIIDLRDNSGGNMWPMLAAVGPILGDGRVGSFVSPDGGKQTWIYHDGQAQDAGVTVIEMKNPYILKRPAPPVAVLTNQHTASSGEAIVVAFRARPSTRSFGEPTAGIPTANNVYRLRDGAELVLTVAADADRTGQTYEQAIVPDQIVPTDVSQEGIQKGTTTDSGVQAALAWLHEQVECRGE